MIYESDITQGSITLPKGGHIRFNRGESRGPGVKPYGELDTGSKPLQKMLRMTEKEINAIVERSRWYERSEVGKKGIWKKLARKSLVEQDQAKHSLEDGLKLLDTEDLRSIAAKAVKPPLAKNAPRDKLIAAIVSAKLKAATAKGDPDADEVPPEGEAEADEE